MKNGGVNKPSLLPNCVFMQSLVTQEVPGGKSKPGQKSDYMDSDCFCQSAIDLEKAEVLQDRAYKSGKPGPPQYIEDQKAFSSGQKI